MQTETILTLAFMPVVHGLAFLFFVVLRKDPT